VNSREIVTAAIEFTGPERIPYSIDIDIIRFRLERSPDDVQEIEKLMEEAPTDFVTLWHAPFKEWRSVGGPEARRVDEWGVTWHQNNAVAHPLEADWKLLDDYSFPDPHKPGRFDRVITEIEQNEERYTLGTVWYTLFERMWTLRGFENMLTDPYLNYDRFVFLREKLLDFDMEILKQWLEIGVDGIFFSDDWGWQSGLLMNPDDWRELYKPCYKKLFDMAHQGGAHVWMHSCGHVTEIIPDLIEIGLDVLNPVQPQAMKVNELGDRFGGELCFHGGVDVQGTLPRGTAEDVDSEVKHLIKTFGCFGGGYIGGTSHTILPDTPLENIRALFEAFERYSKRQASDL
jgi:uroporphyrinogen decarboxylase